MLSTAARSTNIIHPGRMSRGSMIAMTSAYFDGSNPQLGNIVRRAGGQFSAALLYRKVEDVLKSYYYIQFYHTEEAYRRQGLTASMVKELLDKAKKEGVHEVSARVQDWNVGSHQLLTQRLGFTPHEIIYYKLLLEHGASVAERPLPKAYTYVPGDDIKFGNALSLYYASNARATGGVELATSAVVCSLKCYLERDSVKFVLEDASGAFAICEPVQHPYKDFLSVKFYDINKGNAQTMFSKIEALAAELHLPEISIRAADGNTVFREVLANQGYLVSDTSYAHHQ